MNDFDPTGIFAGFGIYTLFLIVLSIASSLLGLWLFYWIVRLAVRHGTRDAMVWQARHLSVPMPVAATTAPAARRSAPSGPDVPPAPGSQAWRP